MLLNNRRGFSLVEIMIVLVIIGIIGSQMAGRIFGGLDRAKIKSAQNLMRTYADQLEMYNTDCNTYPTTDQGLEALVEEPSGEPGCDAWGPKYAKDVAKDPWGRPFIYESDGVEFEIISLGADKREDGEEAGKDIRYSELK